MKRSLIQILVCPICKGSLQLTVVEENDIEIQQGELYCQDCRQNYSIVKGIPKLLPAELQGNSLNGNAR